MTKPGNSPPADPLDPPAQMTSAPGKPIVVENLTMAYDGLTIQRDLNFTVDRGDVFIIMGSSGCGKSTVLRTMIGLQAPAAGRVWLDGHSLWEAEEVERQRLLQKCGVVFQSGGLWSSMTLEENVGLILEEYTDLSVDEISKISRFKLALVGLAGFERHYPAEISGGMQRRAAVARALALDPPILFLDEPSAGLDPISSRRLDDLILELRDSLGATVIVVTHDLESIFSIGNAAVLLDTKSKTQIATGAPRWLRDNSPDPVVREFLNGGSGRSNWTATAVGAESKQ